MTTTSTGLAPRRAALRILERIGKGLEFEVARDLALKDMEERDGRLAHELAAGILRYQNRLDESLAPHVARGLRSVPPTVRGVLRIGAYQLTRLDRVPPHAAVSSAVDLAREVAGNKAAAFVNAVLRRLAARSDSPGSTDPVEPPGGDASAASLARRHTHPEWLVRRWLSRFGPADTARLLAWNNTRPPLVLQPAREALNRVAGRMTESDIPAAPAPYGAGLVVTAGGQPNTLPGFAEGSFFVQDPAQALVVRFAGFAPGSLVYDACAAPGGKTLALGRDGWRVVAGEARLSRLSRLRENLARAGSGREFPIAARADAPPLATVGGLLLDAPCLATGTFRRHPDARLRVTPDKLERSARRQAQLLDTAAGVVGPGGLLVYATCSLEPEENAEQIERFLGDHPAFRREPPSGFPADLLSPAGDLELLPHRHATDGGYAARLRRVR